jgi:hypothetical protein
MAKPTIAELQDELKARDRCIDELRRKIARLVDLAKRRPVGRPIAASEAQQDEVLRLRKQGRSLRAIAEETGLGLRTVVTITGKGEETDRTTMKLLQRIVPDRAAALRDKARTRAIKGLPKAINATRKAGRNLIKEAKGLK